LSEQKYAEAIGVFTLNTELHPEDANLFDSLAEPYDLSGDNENMKKYSSMILNMLGKKTALNDSEKGLKANAEK
jgi:hypothetical protein